MSTAAPRLSLVGGADRTAAGPRRQGFITIRGLSKSFNDAVIYDRFDLDLPQGQFISIFGPNGCGKSTLINMISGLLPLDAGQVLFDGQTIQETRLSYVFQNYRDALFPWLRAIDNIHYPLKLMGLSQRELDRRVGPKAGPRAASSSSRATAVPCSSARAPTDAADRRFEGGCNEEKAFPCRRRPDARAPRRYCAQHRALDPAGGGGGAPGRRAR